MKEKAIKFRDLLSQKKNIVITTHRGPDGDAMGSSLALYNILVNLGHKVTVITPNDYASFLHWMPGNDKVIEYDGNESPHPLIQGHSLTLLDPKNPSLL